MNDLISIIRLRALPALLCLLFLGTGTSGVYAGDKQVPNTLVRLKTVRWIYDPLRPYLSPELRERKTTGVVVGKNAILTRLDNVRDAVSIYVRSNAGGKYKPARVRFMGYDCDLALLSVSGEEQTETQKVAALYEPKMEPGMEVDVYGYDQSNRVSVRRQRVKAIGRGPVAGSDVDKHPLVFMEYTRGHSRHKQNGFAFIKGKLAGVYNPPALGREPHISPAGMIKHFLKDLDDGQYDGFPNAGFYYTPLSNSFHRRRYRLPQGGGGVLIRQVLFRSPSYGFIFPGDILLEVDGKKVAPTGELKIGKKLAPLEDYIYYKQAGNLKLKVIQNGLEKSVTIPVTSPLLFHWQRQGISLKREYFLTGGLVFQEVDFDVAHSKAYGANPLLQYRYYMFYEDQLNEQTDRDVILTGLLNDPANQEAESFMGGIVHSINKRRIRNMRDFEKEWVAGQSEFLVIQFHDRPIPLLLRKKDLKQANRRIYEKFGIRERFSGNESN